MDAKLSCLVKGLIGVLFGCLALFEPAITISTFSKIFIALIIIGMAICIFLAITSHSEGSLFWFLAATALMIVLICSIFFYNLAAIIFIVAIAAVAFYSGLEGILLALTCQRCKYFLIGGAFVVAILLLIAITKYMPSIIPNYDLILTGLSVLGAFSLVFGLFSILMGMYIKRELVIPAAVPQSNPVNPQKEKE